MMKRVILFSILFTGCTTSTQTQWRVADAYDHRNESMGKQIASSGWTHSENGTGKSMRLSVQSRNDAPCTSTIYSRGGPPPADPELVPQGKDKKGFVQDNIFYTPVQVNGNEREAYGVIYGMAPNTLVLKIGHPDDFYDWKITSESEFERLFNDITYKFTRLLVEAETFKITLPTRDYGNLIYKFDMTGSHEAIRTVCSDIL